MRSGLVQRLYKRHESRMNCEGSAQAQDTAHNTDNHTTELLQHWNGHQMLACRSTLPSLVKHAS